MAAQAAVQATGETCSGAPTRGSCQPYGSQALNRLPEDQRLAVALVVIEGLPYKEAAQIIGVPMGTLTSRLARGRHALQQLLGPGDGA
jgi:hypothetical protein